jgi:hypothetical protein
MTTQEKLEALFAKVRALPAERQEALIEFLTEEIAEEPYQSSRPASRPQAGCEIISAGGSSGC